MRIFIVYILILVSSVLTGNKMFGQKVLFPYKQNGETGGIMSFDIKTQNTDTVLRRISSPPNTEIGDFTITPDSIVYANSLPDALYLHKVSAKYNGIDFGKDSLTIPFESYFGTYGGSSNIAIQSNEEGNLFCAGRSLWKYYTLTKVWENLGSLPDFYNIVTTHRHSINCPGAGTLTKINGDYYFITRGKLKYKTENNGYFHDQYYNQKFIRVDTLEPNKSEKIFEFGDTVVVNSLFTVRTSCDEYHTYAFYFRFKNKLSKLPDYGAFGEFDIETGRITEISKIYFFNDLITIFTYGVAVPWTIRDKDCIVLIDLDIDDSSGALGKYNYQDTLRCKYDSIYLADLDPEVFSKTYIDSMQIFFEGIPPDGNNEFLELKTPVGLQLEWRNPRYVSIINNTTEDYLPMDELVKSAVYRNISTSPSFGQRKIAFVAYSGKRQSDTAYAYINLIDIPIENKQMNIDTVLCIGESIDWNGQTIVADGAYSNISTNQYGCDSTTTLNVKYNPNDRIELDTVLCKGEEFDWHDQTIVTAGAYNYSTTNQYGCDSTITLNVKYSPNDRIELDTVLCYNEEIDWNGQTIAIEGEYSYSTTNHFGCDSTTILKVKYNAEVIAKISGETKLCEGETLILDGGTHTKYYWNTGESTKTMEVQKGGWYYLTVTDNGICEGTDSIFVDEIAPIEIAVDFQNESCYQEQDGWILIKYQSGGIGEKKYYLDGEEVTEGEKITGINTGNHTVEVVDEYGCQWEEQIEISAAEENWVNLGEDIKIDKIDSLLTIEAESNIQYEFTIQWYINGSEVANSEMEYTFTPLQNTTIEIVLTDEKGCEIRDTLNIEVRIGVEAKVEISNIFTPDGDGINDVWSMILGKQIKEIEQISIYDRWGSQVYKQEHILVISTITQLWDGTYRAQMVNPGVFVYHAVFKLHNGKTFQKSGDITVVR